MREKRNAEKTRAKIAKVATKLFIERGYHGTSLSEIVSASGYNKRMIYHYFGNKEGLYHDIYKSKINLFSDILKDKISKIDDSKKLKIVFTEIALTIFDLMSADLEFIRLIGWKELEGEKISTGLWENITQNVFEQIKEIFELAISKGEISVDLKRDHMIFGTFGIITSYFSHGKLAEHVIEKNILKESAKNEYKKVIEHFVNSLFL